MQVKSVDGEAEARDGPGSWWWDGLPSGTLKSFSNGSAKALMASKEPTRKERTGAMSATFAVLLRANVFTGATVEVGHVHPDLTTLYILCGDFQMLCHRDKHARVRDGHIDLPHAA